MAANNTPKWWLYQANPSWSADFDAAALGDQDGDGIPTWQEYVSGTDPNDPASVFSLNISMSNGQSVVSFPTATTSAQYQAQRYYALESCTNLLAPLVWTGVEGFTNILASGQTIFFTNIAATSPRFFRGRVWLGP